MESIAKPNPLEMPTVNDDDFDEPLGERQPNANGENVCEDGCQQAITMKSTNTPMTLGNAVLGVFAFLDATLSPDMIAEAAVYVLEDDRENLPFRSLRQSVRKFLQETFRLQYWACPLTKELEEFRIYHRNDMADALTVAYFLEKRGADPLNALKADYSYYSHALLEWVDIDKLRKKARHNDDSALWWKFNSLHKEGDRLIRYRSRVEHGYALVRGDRLVGEVITAHMEVSRPSPRNAAEVSHFESLGGTRGFLNEDFVWPDPDWVNPVTDEEELAAGGKWQRGLIIEATPGTMECSIE
jgi:hypothetical protein